MLMVLAILRTWGRGGGRRHKVAALGQDRKVAHLQSLKNFLIHQINLAFYPRPALPPWADVSNWLGHKYPGSPKVRNLTWR